MPSIRRPFGSTDLSVFPVAFGGTVFGTKADGDESHRLLDAYRAGGGNFLDTADAYQPRGDGSRAPDSESIIGSWLKASKARDDMVIATKVGKHPAFPGLGAANIRRAAEASLRRLQTDRIDLYFPHYDDQSVPVEEAASAFSQLVDAGKIRYIGLSNYSGARVTEWLNVAAENGLHRPVALQPHYNLVERGDFESDLLPVALAHSLAAIPYWGLASGFLTGKYRSERDDARNRSPAAAPYVNEHGIRVIDVLGDIAEEHRTEIPAVALAWLAARPTVVASISSASSTAQLPALLAAASLSLTDAEHRRLDEVSDQLAGHR